MRHGGAQGSGGGGSFLRLGREGAARKHKQPEPHSQLPERRQAAGCCHTKRRAGCAAAWPCRPPAPPGSAPLRNTQGVCACSWPLSQNPASNPDLQFSAY